jgi:hypothetical protein
MTASKAENYLRRLTLTWKVDTGLVGEPGDDVEY